MLTVPLAIGPPFLGEAPDGALRVTGAPNWYNTLLDDPDPSMNGIALDVGTCAGSAAGTVCIVSAAVIASSKGMVFGVFLSG